MPEHQKQDRAERLFKAREQQKADAPQAMAEYHAAIERVRARTDELRRQRLAREARKDSRKRARSA
jgi:L-amino acid N-acyltransferase YncA